MFIVGFTGKAGVGKDTAGAALVKYLGFYRYAFADPLKAALSAMLGESTRKWEDREWKESPLDFGPFPIYTASPRHLAQTLGTEWGRDVIDRDFWVALAAYRVNKSGHDRIVFTDVRFDNEARWIQSSGGWVIEIVRPDANPVSVHISEQGINPNLIDFTIPNFYPSATGLEDKVLFEVRKKLEQQDLAGLL